MTWRPLAIDELQSKVIRFPWVEAAPSGVLITIEGSDGSGKSTYIEALRRYLADRDVDVLVTKLPTGLVRDFDMFKIFRQFRHKYDPRTFDMLAMQVLLMGDRLAHMRVTLRDLYSPMRVILCDRYILSSAGHLLINGFPLSGWFSDLCRLLPQPHLQIYLHAPAEVALGRIRERPDEKDEEFDAEHFTALTEACSELARVNDMRFVHTDTVPIAAYERLFCEMLGASVERLRGRLSGRER
jgi:dTMP kinase